MHDFFVPVDRQVVVLGDEVSGIWDKFQQTDDINACEACNDVGECLPSLLVVCLCPVWNGVSSSPDRPRLVASDHGR